MMALFRNCKTSWRLCSSHRLKSCVVLGGSEVINTAWVQWNVWSDRQWLLLYWGSYRGKNVA